MPTPKEPWADIDLSPAAMTVNCWDCRDTFEVASDMEGQAYRTGTIKRRIENDTDSMWMGICPKCQKLHDRADDPTKTIPRRRPPVATDETTRILFTALELRENNPALTREASIHLAVDLYFDPEREKNPEFRQFLIDHAS